MTMGKRTIYLLTAVSLIIALLQLTSLAFLPKDAGDFVWGLTGGLAIGAFVVWIVTRSGSR
jgi:hypothetical protein